MYPKIPNQLKSYFFLNSYSKAVLAAYIGPKFLCFGFVLGKHRNQGFNVYTQNQP